MASIDFDQLSVTDLKYYDIVINDPPNFRCEVTQVQLITAGDNGFMGVTDARKTLVVSRLTDENENKRLEILLDTLGGVRQLFYVIRDQNMVGDGFSAILVWMKEQFEKDN